jgi:hypothetical protein
MVLLLVFLPSFITSAGSSESASITKQTFGLSTVLARTHPHKSQWLVVGTVSRAVDFGNGEGALVVGGAEKLSGQWRVRLLVRYALGGVGGSDCRTEPADQLVPGENVLIAGCLNGGSDGESFVVVLGFSPASGFPQILLSADCGVTTWKLNRNVLTIESWDLKAGGAQPSQRHPDALFQWEGNRINGGLGTSSPLFPSDASTTPTVCKSLSMEDT